MNVISLEMNLPCYNTVDKATSIMSNCYVNYANYPKAPEKRLDKP